MRAAQEHAVVAAREIAVDRIAVHAEARMPVLAARAADRAHQEDLAALRRERGGVDVGGNERICRRRGADVDAAIGDEIAEPDVGVGLAELLAVTDERLHDLGRVAAEIGLELVEQMIADRADRADSELAQRRDGDVATVEIRSTRRRHIGQQSPAHLEGELAVAAAEHRCPPAPVDREVGGQCDPAGAGHLLVADRDGGDLGAGITLLLGDLHGGGDAYRGGRYRGRG